MATHFPLTEDVGYSSSSSFVEDDEDPPRGGTTAYLSPEQLDRLERSPFSDIYSFAMVVYEILTGRLPIDSTLPPYRRMRDKVEGRIVDPRNLMPALSDNVADAILWGLKLEPQLRPRSAMAMCQKIFATDGHAKHRWLPGAFSELPALVDRNASQLDPILQAAVGALGSGFGEVLARSFATGARDIASALYEAIRCNTRLQYDHEPANPGDQLQEVRIANQVLSFGVGTCLDLALLYAALAERAHLAPGILIVRNNAGWHAMGGFFDAGSESGIASVVTDSKVISDLARSGSFVAIETTGLSVAEGRKKGFARACEEGTLAIQNATPVALVNILAGREMGLAPPA
jgi:hypothetical protein